jgi:hypothetical protein
MSETQINIFFRNKSVAKETKAFFGSEWSEDPIELPYFSATLMPERSELPVVDDPHVNLTTT